ncbi:MAG: ATP-binding protein, partial [Psychrosphaera sp.]|nr:ATP-binding protein [Psychrosphaera sp.]
MNRQLKEIDKLKDEFLANTSHELRTPLNGIIGLAESLMDGVAGPLPECANHNLAMVVSSGRRLENLVNDILDFSKLKNHRLTLTKGPVDIYSLVEVVLALSRPLLGKKPVKLINDTYKDLPSVDADENRLMQIMHNLVGNAIKFTDAGSVTVSAVPSSKMNDQNLTISIQDTGIGIDACEFDHIFESFEQVEGGASRGRSGTGLGLAVTKQLIELHGGTIMVESEPGQGSTFTFTLLKSEQQGGKLSDDSAQGSANQQTISRLHKLAQEAEQTLPIAEDNASQNGHAGRILLVDDEPINRQVLTNLLSLQNYQLVEATGGAQALKMINDDGPFDLVLLDIMMPNVSGYEVCRVLRETFCMSDLPVIFLTAKNQVGDLVQSFAMGGNDYLTKPVTKHELLARVETHLKLQDINRNLEQKVAERTEDLERKHQNLLNTEKALANKEHQRKLAQSETLASLGTLTAGVGHEINNPVNFIGLGAHALGTDLKAFESYLFELAGEDAEADVLDGFRQHLSPLYKHIDTIVNGTDRVKVIVQDLRSFTQQDSTEQQTVIISGKLQSTLNLVKPKYIDTIDFGVEFDDALQLQCYPAQLNQVF